MMIHESSHSEHPINFFFKMITKFLTPQNAEGTLNPFCSNARLRIVCKVPSLLRANRFVIIVLPYLFNVSVYIFWFEVLTWKFGHLQNSRNRNWCDRPQCHDLSFRLGCGHGRLCVPAGTSHVGCVTAS